jgi:predicted PurR-regulated permease PerM
MFMLAIAQVGPLVVLVPAVVWLYWSSGIGWGTFLLIWTLVVAAMDSFLRPILIKKGADLSLVLIFAGVVGGLIAFGLIGIFVGPVVLAVSHTLLSAWVDEDIAAVESRPQQEP